MTVLDASGQLPGGVSLARAYLLLLPEPGLWIAGVLIRGVLVVAAVEAARRGNTGIAIGLGAAVFISVLDPVISLLSPPVPGVAVTAAAQPYLNGLVAEVAAAAGVPAPDQIWLTARVEVAGRFDRGRRELRIGLPALACLSRLELRAVLAHELCVLDQPHPVLVDQLHRRWMALTRRQVWSQRPSTSTDRSVARLRPLATQVHAGADSVAAELAGGDAALAAILAVLDSAAFEYPGAGNAVDTPPHRAPDGWATNVGWRRLLALGTYEGAWSSDFADLGAELHPALATAFGELRDRDVIPLRLSADPVAVEPIPLPERKRLRL